MEHLFAPWRIKYIKMAQEKDIDCIFCYYPSCPKEEDLKNLLLHRGKRAFVIFNRFPYNPGHLMVAPYKHTGNLEDLSVEETIELHELVVKCVSVIKKTMNPEGFNIGINIGKTAGAGFKDHIHIHIVPRWNGDTNFMPVIADTKVIPEALTDTYKKLKENW